MCEVSGKKKSIHLRRFWTTLGYEVHFEFIWVMRDFSKNNRNYEKKLYKPSYCI